MILLLVVAASACNSEADAPCVRLVIHPCVILLLVVAASACNSVADAPCVSGITPQYGSLNGGTRVTIDGYGKNQNLLFFYYHQCALYLHVH